MSQADFITALFCRVDDMLSDCTKDKRAKLHPSEVVTLSLLFCIKGGSSRRFYLWATYNLLPLFPNLPDRSNLLRAFARFAPLAERFLAPAGPLGIADSLGVEMIHPRRAGRSAQQFGKKGLSNKRWIVGAKVCPLVRGSDGLICDWRFDTANVHDSHFHDMIADQQTVTTVLADGGFHLSDKHGGDPKNLVICQRGERNERMLVETVFSLLTGCLHLKKVGHRVEQYVLARLAYAFAAFNLLLCWTGTPRLSIAWAVL